MGMVGKDKRHKIQIRTMAIRHRTKTLLLTNHQASTKLDILRHMHRVTVSSTPTKLAISLLEIPSNPKINPRDLLQEIFSIPSMFSSKAQSKFLSYPRL